MKVIKRSISILFIIYFSLIFFNGLYTKFLFPLGLILIKKILPELVGGALIILMSIVCIKCKKNEKNIYLFSLIFFAAMFVLQMFSMEDGNLIKSIRDNLMPFILLYVIQCYQYDIEEKNYLISLLEKFMKIFVLSGAVLGIVQFILGAEWTAQFYTGYNFYERDSATGIMIWHLGEYLRVPSVTGDSVIFAMCNLFAFFFFDLIRKGKYLKYLSFLNIIISTSRTLLIVFLIYLLLSRMCRLYMSNKNVLCVNSDNKIYLKIKNYSFIKDKGTLFIISFTGTLLFIFFFIIFFFVRDLPLLASLFERINGVWIKIFQDLAIEEFFIGKGVFEVGVGMKPSLAANSDYNYIFSFIDNTYIYILLCYGIFGLALYVILNVKLLKDALKYKNINYCCFIIASMIGALTLNYMQGRSYIFLFVIYTIFINYNEQGEEKNEKIIKKTHYCWFRNNVKKNLKHIIGDVLYGKLSNYQAVKKSPFYSIRIEHKKESR